MSKLKLILIACRINGYEFSKKSEEVIIRRKDEV